MAEKFSKFDPVDYLDSPARIVIYLAVAEKEKDPSLLAKAHETVKKQEKGCITKIIFLSK